MRIGVLRRADTGIKMGRPGVLRRADTGIRPYECDPWIVKEKEICRGLKIAFYVF